MEWQVQRLTARALKVMYCNIMTNQEVEKFCTGISSFAWDKDFEKFCETCDFDPRYSYSMEKWQQFKELNQLLSKFDNNVMTKIVRTGLKLPLVAEVEV